MLCIFFYLFIKYEFCVCNVFAHVCVCSNILWFPKRKDIHFTYWSFAKVVEFVSIKISTPCLFLPRNGGISLSMKIPCWGVMLSQFNNKEFSKYSLNLCQIPRGHFPSCSLLPLNGASWNSSLSFATFRANSEWCPFSFNYLFQTC